MYFMEDFRQQNQLLDFCRKLGRGASLGYQNEKETMEKIQINSWFKRPSTQKRENKKKNSRFFFH